MSEVFIKSYYGFGDNIFLFPFIKEACKKYSTVYLETTFPFLFETLPNIKFVKPDGGKSLQTCQKSIKQYDSLFVEKKPNYINAITIPYYLSGFKKGNTLIECFNQALPIETSHIDYTIPINPDWIKQAKLVFEKINTKKKICIIKPPSNRSDWKNNARIPKKEYYQKLIDKYKSEYFFISISNNKIEQVQRLKNIDLRYEAGELDLTTIIGIASMADMIITYNCFLFPLGMAVNTKTFVINGGYSNPEKYIDRKRMILSHVEIINPTKLCECINLKHKCNKNINERDLLAKFKELHNKGTEFSCTPIKSRKNLLICRLPPFQCEKILQNSNISANFKIFTVSHFSTRQYKGKGFANSFEFPSIGNICTPTMTPHLENQIRHFCRNILDKCEIDLVINAQPLHPYHELMDEACIQKNIPSINTETAFDGKWLFDYVGCQYTTINEINQFIDKIPNIKSPILYPRKTRQEQPKNITKDMLLNKYNLKPHAKYIVILGQLMWDMSIKETTNSDIKTYEEYFYTIINANPDITFIIKYHPQYFRLHREKDMRFLKEYPNVVVVNESLDTLFSTFQYFTSFSSTAIIEGIVKNKIFATMGYHYCNNDNLVLQLKSNEEAYKLYDKLQNFNINQKTKEKYMRFIFNYYTIDLRSQQLYQRLTMSSEEYFSLKL